MKGKRVIAAILLVGILAATLAGCKNEDISKKETEKPVITLGSDNYPPYNGADVRLGVNENILARAERGELL